MSGQALLALFVFGLSLMLAWRLRAGAGLAPTCMLASSCRSRLTVAEAAGLWACRAGPSRASQVPPSGHAHVRSCTPDPVGLLSPWEGCCSRRVLSWKVHSPPVSGLSSASLMGRTLTPVFREASPTGGPGREPVCALVAMSLHQAGLLPSHLHGEGQAGDGPPPHSCPCSVLWDQSCSA